MGVNETSKMEKLLKDEGAEVPTFKTAPWRQNKINEYPVLRLDDFIAMVKLAKPAFLTREDMADLSVSSEQKAVLMASDPRLTEEDFVKAGTYFQLDGELYHLAYGGVVFLCAVRGE